jgi:antitoxin PrlF
VAIARITSKGQITVPKEIRERLGVETGDSLEFHFEADRLEVRPLRRRRIAEFRGLFAVDEACTFTEERERAWAEVARRHLEDDPAPDA